MKFRSLAALLSAALLAGCSSTPKNTNIGRPSAAERGFRVLDAIVVGRDFEPVGGGSRSSAAGPGAYYLEFEAREGDTHVHYRFPVTRQQYQRYSEGDEVQLVLANDRLRELRPITK